MILSIASIGIAATVITGTVPHTNPLHHREADRILEQNVYQYKGTRIFGGHNYSTFLGLENIHKGARVRIGKTLYAVTGTKVISETETWLLRRKGVFLFTCYNGTDDRFIVFLREI